MTTRPPQNNRYLTPERKQILDLFATHPYLTHQQVCELLGAIPKHETPGDAENVTHRNVQKRLNLMSKAGYLKRQWSYTDPTEVTKRPNNKFCYSLGKYGAMAVHGTFTAEKSPYSLPHDAEITQFHIELGQEWTNGRVYWQQRDLKKAVYPDALFGLTRGGKDVHYFFLEIEKSRQGHYEVNPDTGKKESELVKKLRRYDAYRRTPQCKKEWVYFDDFRVCVIVKTEERKQNLLAKLAGILPYRFIWIATEEDYKRNIMGGIFHTPKDHLQRSYSFHDIA